MDNIHESYTSGDHLQVNIPAGQTACMLYTNGSEENPGFNGLVREFYQTLENRITPYLFENHNQESIPPFWHQN